VKSTLFFLRKRMAGVEGIFSFVIIFVFVEIGGTRDRGRYFLNISDNFRNSFWI